MLHFHDIKLERGAFRNVSSFIGFGNLHFKWKREQIESIEFEESGEK